MPDEQTAITYLVACYNQAPYVADCLRSLVRQRDPRWRAIVADDASTDDSLSIIGSVQDARMRVLTHARNLGYIATLRHLIEEADTDIVAILDADDVVTPETTERLLAAFAAHPDAALVYSRYAVFDEKMSRQQSVYGAAVPTGGSAIHDGVVGAIRAFRRSAYRLTSGLDDSMRYAEDRDLVYKLEELSAPVFVDAVLYHYRRVPSSQSQQRDKREIGARNVRRARRAALDRRGLRGLRRIPFELYGWADYLAYSDRRPRIVRFAANTLARAARALCARVDSMQGRRSSA